MNILSLISRNLQRGPVTLRFPERVVPAGGFRGLVCLDPRKCLACGICDYVCVSAAISVTAGDDHCDWDYDPGRCTFCGRCVEHCPGAALTQNEDKPPTYDYHRGLQRVQLVTYPACPECGRPAHPYSERLLQQAFGYVGGELRRRARLCERCRLRHAQRTMKPGPAESSRPGWAESSQPRSAEPSGDREWSDDGR